MEPLARVGVFVQRRAVELAKPMRIGREMAGHPVQDHTQTPAVSGIDKGAEFGRRPVADRGGEHADRLVPPASVKGIFADRQAFDMGEPHVGGIIHQLLGQFLVVRYSAAYRKFSVVGDGMGVQASIQVDFNPFISTSICGQGICQYNDGKSAQLLEEMRSGAQMTVQIQLQNTMAGPFHGIFIRAPRLEPLGGTEILGRRANGEAVLLRSGRILAASFHPELSGDDRLHEYFLSLC